VPAHFNHFSEVMEELGHECNEVVFDLESLQKSWAKENGIKYANHSWKFDILIEQIRHYNPEILFLQNLTSLPFWILQRIKDFVPSIHKVIAFKGNLPHNNKEIEHVDYVFAGHPDILAECIKNNKPAELLYHCFDEKILQLLNLYQSPQYPFTFIGYSGFSGFGVMHTERYRLLRSLAEVTQIQMWVLEEKDIPNSTLPKDSLPLQVQFPDKCNSGVFGMEMYSILANSDIVFNKHAEIARNHVANMRLFETTGVGTCLISDTGKNMTDLFDKDREIVTYNCKDELLEKVSFLQNNKSYLIEIAKAGQKRTLKDHTLRARAKQINFALQEIL
jgi:spore maturation protein CgeB